MEKLGEFPIKTIYIRIEIIGTLLMFIFCAWNCLFIPFALLLDQDFEIPAKDVSLWNQILLLFVVLLSLALGITAAILTVRYIRVDKNFLGFRLLFYQEGIEVVFHRGNHFIKNDELAHILHLSNITFIWYNEEDKKRYMLRINKFYIKQSEKMLELLKMKNGYEDDPARIRNITKSLALPRGSYLAFRNIKEIPE